MRNGPITIPDVAGLVTVDTNLWSGKQTVIVGDHPAASSGKRKFALPMTDGGTVEGTVSRSTFISPFPTVEVLGVKHRTGADIPVALRILMVAPILLVAGGLLGALIAVAGIFVNFSLVRSSRTPAVK